jgi:hypothetical protein
LPVTQLLNECQVLRLKHAPHRDYHAPPGLELFDEWGRHMAGGRGYKNTIERAAFWPAEVTVADPGLDVPMTKVLKTLGSSLTETRDDFNSADFLDQGRNNCGLITRTSTNLEHS